MKTRSGFVSNSSSSSFVLIGWMFDKSEKSLIQVMEETIRLEALNLASLETFRKPWNDLDEQHKKDLYYERFENRSKFTILDHEENGAPDDKIVVGRMLVLGDDVEQKIIKFDELSNFLNGLPYARKDAIVLTGTMLT